MYIPDPGIESLEEALRGLQLNASEGVLILLGDRNVPDLGRLSAKISRLGIRFVGGVFPGLISHAKRYDSGAVLVRLPMPEEPLLIQNLGLADLSRIEWPAPLGGEKRACQAVMLVDGFASGIDELLTAQFQRFGNRLTYFGGGAGYSDMKQRPCLFCRRGVFQDAALVAFVDSASVMGVGLGWSHIAGPLVATRTSKNVLYELNWRSAFSVYREILQQHRAVALDSENFYPVGKSYPFGLIRAAEEAVVRDPLRIGDRGEMICCGDIPENTALNILWGDQVSLIAAARQAALSCRAQWAGPIRKCLLADCISRAMFLGEEYERELEALWAGLAPSETSEPIEGMLTWGEISSYGEDGLEFLNKTVVVSLLYEN